MATSADSEIAATFSSVERRYLGIDIGLDDEYLRETAEAEHVAHRGQEAGDDQPDARGLGADQQHAPGGRADIEHIGEVKDDLSWWSTPSIGGSRCKKLCSARDSSEPVGDSDFGFASPELAEKHQRRRTCLLVAERGLGLSAPPIGPDIAGPAQ